jgi:hypothetical protein
MTLIFRGKNTSKLLIFEKHLALPGFQECGSSPDKHRHQGLFTHLAAAVTMHFGVKHNALREQIGREEMLACSKDFATAVL